MVRAAGPVRVQVPDFQSECYRDTQYGPLPFQYDQPRLRVGRRGNKFKVFGQRATNTPG